MDSSTASTASLSRLISALCLARFAEVFRRDRSRLAWCMFSATRATKRHGTRDLRRSPGACIFVCKSGKEKFSSLGYEVSREARKARNASCTPFMPSMDRSVPSAFWQPEKAAELTYVSRRTRAAITCACPPVPVPPALPPPLPPPPAPTPAPPARLHHHRPRARLCYFVMLPSLSLPPVVFYFGTSPVQAARLSARCPL
jgi:hypothetical protein